MKTKLPYLFERNGSYFFRRRVPERFRARAGCHEWKHRLGPSARDDAALLMELRVLTDATDRAIATLGRGSAPALCFLQTAWDTLYPECAAEAVPTLSQAAEVYARLRGVDALEKPEQMALDQFIAFMGDLRVDEIQRRKVREWIGWLAEKRGQGSSTVKRRLCSVSAFCTAVIDQHELDLANPFSRHRVPTGVVGFREPFTRDQLALINAWLKTPWGDRTSGLIIRLLRATGARPLEIGGLVVADVRLDHELPHIFIRPNAFRGLKTPGSSRLLPLVEDAVIAAEQAISRADGEALFPPACHDTGRLSARLNKAIRSTGVPKRKELTAYSFRHTVQEAMRLSGAPFDVQRAVLGHAKTTVTERYGARQVPLELMRKALEQAAIHRG
ncbi:tyrosine-type recombinase/integrase [Maricaulis maris]|uniref:tyrosine-type recombinase/integrase n=1 Tax=Maricaulis maris TaxID=74318 RepID=UPI003A8D1F93